MELSLSIRKQQGDFLLDTELVLQGERIGIFGPSGSGKSTLVSLITGLARPDAGRIMLGDQVLFDSTSRVDLTPEQRRIALVFQHHALFPHLNVRQNLLYGYRRCPASERRIELAEVAAVLGLTALLDNDPSTLSGGERQRVALGRAVLSSPRLLIMDEPLSALDDDLRYRIIPYLREVNIRFAIPFVFISHSLLEMRLMTEWVAVLERGRMVTCCTPEELARMKMGTSPVGYVNLLQLDQPPLERDGLLAFPWAGRALLLADGSKCEPGLFELSSKEIVLCKRHPEAISARNLLPCVVRSLFDSGSKIGVELDCNGATLVAEIVPMAARELQIIPGGTIWAVIKASSFRRL